MQNSTGITEAPEDYSSKSLESTLFSFQNFILYLGLSSSHIMPCVYYNTQIFTELCCGDLVQFLKKIF